MKNLFLGLAAVLSFGYQASAQVDIHLDASPTVSQNGQSVPVLVDDASNFKVYMHCVNTSGSAASYLFRREILSSSTSFGDQFCDDNLCYPLSGTVDMTDAPMNVAAGDSTKFQPQYNFFDGGTATIRYSALNAADSVEIDYVDLDITSVVGMDKPEISLIAYPNPANEVFNIHVQAGQAETMKWSLFNVSGQLVSTQNLSNGNNTIDLSGFENGTYTYVVEIDNERIQSKQLVINH